MKPYGNKKGWKKHYSYCLLLLAALLYSIFLCISSIRDAATRQMQELLYIQMQTALLNTLAGEENQVFVHLRRDNNNDITAVTVNGILLSQLQVRYRDALTAAAHPKYKIRFTTADLLGSKLFAWIPGSISLSCKPEIRWDATVVSRTLEQIDDSKQFQLVLMTTASANCVTWLHAELREEVLLYETVIYTAAP